jgi:hypothetical protein
VAAAPPEPESKPEPEPVSVAPAAIEGTLTLRNGKTVRIELSGDTAPAPERAARLLRFFSGKAGEKSPLGVLGGLLGNASISGWLAIADVRVKKIEGKIVTLEIEAERSKMVVNGKPVNHFAPGATVRLEDSEAPAP